MTKFLYIADTHLGATPIGYQQQKRYPERIAEIVSALNAYLLTEPNIDFVLHGGDIIDTTSDENILAATALFQLPVPLHLCLGNHDLTESNALERWLRLAPDFFANGSPEQTIQTETCLIHVVPNQWHEIPYHWEEAQKIHFLTAQEAYLTEHLKRSPDLPHILLTHSPVFGLPIEQTRLSESFHAPLSSFTDSIADLATQHPNLKVVLGAHNHMNMRINHRGAEYGEAENSGAESSNVECVTVSALVETPFEFKRFEVTEESITMSTVSLAKSLNFDYVYDETRRFVQGRSVDRSFSMVLSNPI